MTTPGRIVVVGLADFGMWLAVVALIVVGGVRGCDCLGCRLGPATTHASAAEGASQ